MRIGGCAVVVVVAMSLLLAASLKAAEWHVSPNGTKEGDGSAAKPWDLATAFAAPQAVHPGDVIWLHGGTYNGGLGCQLKGTAEKPIIVRQAPGERAIIDGGDSKGKAILVQFGEYTWFWGFEVMSSDPMRRTEMTASWPADLKRGGGVDAGNDEKKPGIGTKFINLIIHDTSQGVSLWRYATDSEAYGCLIYYNGWDAPDRGHGHGIYAQGSETSKPILSDNIIFAQYSHGIHVYGSEKACLDNFDIEGNISFNNGILSKTTGYTRNFLLGGGRTALNPIIVENYGYFSPIGGSALIAELGYSHGSKNMTIKNNYFGGTGMRSFHIRCEGPAVVTGNTFFGSVEGEKVTLDPEGKQVRTTISVKEEYPDNTYIDPATAGPTGIHVFVRPNKYEDGRANIVVFNWDNADTVTADVSKALKPGDAYQVLDAQNCFGPAVAEGTYDGNPISLPMNLTAVTEVVGAPHADFAHTPKEFGVFVLIRKKLGGE